MDIDSHCMDIDDKRDEKRKKYKEYLKAVKAEVYDGSYSASYDEIFKNTIKDLKYTNTRLDEITKDLAAKSQEEKEYLHVTVRAVQHILSNYRRCKSPLT